MAAARSRDDGPRADAADALPAALGDATLACLGTAGPGSYTVADGTLARTFDSCTTRDTEALERINLPSMETVRLMGSRPSVQKSDARYAVRSEDCADGRCTTRRGAQCAAGFSDAFVVRTDARASEILIDPNVVALERCLRRR